MIIQKMKTGKARVLQITENGKAHITNYGKAPAVADPCPSTLEIVITQRIPEWEHQLILTADSRC